MAHCCSAWTSRSKIYAKNWLFNHFSTGFWAENLQIYTLEIDRVVYEEVSLKNSWNNRGISMEYAWNKYGWSMDAVWKFVWIMYGICMDWAWMRVWNMYGISMEYPGRYFLLEIFFEIFIFSIFFWNFENLKSRFRR